MPSDRNGASYFQQVFEKNLEFTSEVWVFSLFCEFQHLLDSILAAEPSRTILSIDRSEPRFERHTGGKMAKLKKRMEILTAFVNFWLNQIQNCSVQIKKMKDGIFSFQLKKKNYFCQTFTNDARLKNVPPPLDLTRILKSYHKRNDRRKFPEKQEPPIPREINRAA